MNKAVLDVRTLILSDVHLGAPDCRIDEVNLLLKHVRCGKLILNGDIIDGWSLLREGRWGRGHTRFVRLVLKKLEKHGTEVVYLRGNHDDILGRFLPLAFDRLRIVEEHVHESPSGRYLVVHGDVFDVVTRNHRALAVLGALGYYALLRLNRAYNRWRAWRGKEYFSLSKAIKARVKGAIGFVGRFEDQLQDLARRRGCRGVICGHIHTPADREIGEVRYLNSGDWIESLTAIVEHHDGRFEIVEFEAFRDRVSRRLARTTALRVARRAARRRLSAQPLSLSRSASA